MIKTQSSRAVYRFGVFEADAGTGELRKHGTRLRLATQPFKILILLIEARGELVTREEIQRALWPEGTFVDFDHSLNSAINKLREALSDSASTPRYIETLAKRGYRFLPPVTADPDLIEQAIPKDQRPSSAVLTSEAEVPRLEHASAARTTFLLTQVMYLCFYIAALARLGEIEELFAEITQHSAAFLATLIAAACVGIASRLFIGSAIWLRAPHAEDKFLKLFPLFSVLDLLWAASPLLMVHHIGFGLALAACAALTLVPFGERTLILMMRRAENGPRATDIVR